jgi:hypothetical protein
VREWRAIQTDRNLIELQLEFLTDADLSFDEQALVRQLRAFGLPDEISVVVEPVVGLQPDKKTGKFRRMISQIGPPLDPARGEKTMTIGSAAITGNT